VSLLARLRRRDAELEAKFAEFPHYDHLELPRNRERGAVSGGFSTPDDPPAVIEYYAEQLRLKGWQIEQRERAPGLVAITGRRRAR
jgi:hypothetical protein